MKPALLVLKILLGTASQPAISQIDTLDSKLLVNDASKFLFNNQDRAIEICDQIILLAKQDDLKDTDSKDLPLTSWVATKKV